MFYLLQDDYLCVCVNMYIYTFFFLGLLGLACGGHAKQPICKIG